ncbi:hypothetical protein [Pedobacter flavus]|uniref:Uncharacterized protein n=1 Tax=Pedobacter flavus TaxID=3113906 RepID=A0ABU7H0F7_9SPHI|nr:hypothetical protein [Pedobacter sp. VNH31]MEE1884816.1 hypothetical protein [Pedobacter sp. VNH31]
MSKQKTTSNDKINYIAESLLERFIPKDKEVNSLKFCFTLPPSESYEAHFIKKNNIWELISVERQFPNL